MAKLPYSAAACDLDSTLLTDSTLSQENRRAVQGLKERGVQIVLATGRNFHQSVRYYRALRLTSPMVTSDGALVSFPNIHGSIISEQPMPLKASQAIIAEAASRDVTCLNFYRHGIYVSTQADWSDGMERHKEMGRRYKAGHPGYITGRNVYKTLHFSENPDRLDILQADILARYGNVVDAIRNNPFTLEFIGKGVSKVSGLVAAAAHMGLQPSQVVAFGDGVNDVGMFGWAGLSVCMHHGHQLAKDAADMVAPISSPETNFAAAVAAVLRRRVA